MIECKGLSKHFGSTQALKNVSIQFKENTIYGLLGRNAAGKSTLLNLISNRIFPTMGEVTIDGVNNIEQESALRKMYCMSEQDLYPDSMKIKDVLYWSSEFYEHFDMDYAIALAGKFQLSLNKKVKQLSTGYKSMYKLIVALSCNAPYILLDEPVLGLDANHRELFYQELIKNYLEHPKTIVISTHLIEEISNVLEEVVIIKQGAILLQEKVEDLLAKGYTISGLSDTVDHYCKNKEVIGFDTLGGLKTAYLLGEVSANLENGLTMSKLDLQKLFVKLTNE